MWTLPIVVERDTTLRVKVIDSCGLTCTFCHNEGTPVGADNQGRANDFVASGASGRSSIYVPRNGARFLPAAVPSDGRFGDVLGELREALQLEEVHLTGGEPTLHPKLAELVRIAAATGMRVAMTTNGQRGASVIPACAAAGLERVNFSVFGTTAEELAEVQHPRYRNRGLAQLRLRTLRLAIDACAAHGVKASANIVVPDRSHIQRVHRLLDDYSHHLTVRLLNSLGDGPASIEAVEEVLTRRGAVAESVTVTAGVSGTKTAYRLPDGRLLWFKQIRPVRLPNTCSGCQFNNGTDCQEGFYGIRLYYDDQGCWQVGVCIQRMDLCLPLHEFLASPLIGEILALRRAEYRRLVARWAGEPEGATSMPIEYEGKILDIDPEATERRILDSGGERHGERLMRRHVYDVTPGDKSTWIRLRDDGARVTLCVKQITSDAIDGTRECEVEVDDFAGADHLLGMLGFTAKSYQENRRTSFTLDGASLEIDSWPGIPPYLEIEAANTESVIRVAALLGHTALELTGENTTKVYARHGIDLDTVPDLRF